MFGTVLVVVAMLGQPAANPPIFKVPHQADEIPLARLKANAERYAGKTFIICGGIELDDYYNYAYRGQEDIHQSLRFFEAGETSVFPHGEVAHLYLVKKYGDKIMDIVMKKAEEGRGEQAISILVRAKVALTRGWNDRQWDLLELIDIQRVSEDKTGWGPWIEESARSAKAVVEKAEQERADESKRKQAEARAPKFRTWTDASGEHKTTAKLKTAAAGNVKLEKEDGTVVTVPVDTLSEEDQEYLKQRRH
jgi:hypothetical protein